MEQPHWELSLEHIKPGCFSDSPERPPTSCEHMCLESRVGNVSLQVTGDYQNWSTEIKRVRIDRTWGTSDWGAWGDPIFRMLLSHYIPELYHLCGYRMFILCYEGGGHVGFSWVRLLASYSEYAPLFRLLCSQVMAPGWPPQPLYSRNMDKACGAVSNSCWLIKHTKEIKLPLVCFLTHLFGLLVVYPNPKRWIKDFV